MSNALVYVTRATFKFMLFSFYSCLFGRCCYTLWIFMLYWDCLWKLPLVPNILWYDCHYRTSIIIIIIMIWELIRCEMHICYYMCDTVGELTWGFFLLLQMLRLSRVATDFSFTQKERWKSTGKTFEIVSWVRGVDYEKGRY